MASKRPLPWHDDDGTLSRPRKRWRSLVLEIRGRKMKAMHGSFGFREIIGEDFMTMFLPIFGSMVRRVVAEEVEKAIFKQFSAPAPPRLLVDRNQHPRYQFVFLNELKRVYYTLTKLEAKNGTPLKVAIVKTDQKNVVRSGHLSPVKVEIVVLHGNFNANNEENWSTEEFNKHIVSGRDKSGQLLTGSLVLKLTRGEASLENATFTDNSSFTKTKMFRLGVRLVDASGERVIEGVTDPFRVKERRVEVFEKHYPPLLEDEVWRLEKIGRNGPYHQALSSHGIQTVQKFLQSYVKDEQKLLQIFDKMPTFWKAITGHAMKCDLGDDLYSYQTEDKNVVLFFDAIYQLVGVKFGDCYKPLGQLNPFEKNLVETLKQVAYENTDSLHYDHKMINNCPVPHHRFQPEDTSLLSIVLPNQQIPNYSQCHTYPREVSTVQQSKGKEKVCSFQGASDASLEMSRFVQYQATDGIQSSHQTITNKVIPYNSDHGTFLSGSRISQMHVSNSQRTNFGSDTIAAAVLHSNILGGQVDIHFSQFGHGEQFHSSQEPHHVKLSAIKTINNAVINQQCSFSKFLLGFSHQEQTALTRVHAMNSFRTSYLRCLTVDGRQRHFLHANGSRSRQH